MHLKFRLSLLRSFLSRLAISLTFEMWPLKRVAKFHSDIVDWIVYVLWTDEIAISKPGVCDVIRFYCSEMGVSFQRFQSYLRNWYFGCFSIVVFEFYPGLLVARGFGTTKRAI